MVAIVHLQKVWPPHTYTNTQARVLIKAVTIWKKQATESE